jgi:hypothetical protein
MFKAVLYQLPALGTLDFQTYRLAFGSKKQLPAFAVIFFPLPVN